MVLRLVSEPPKMRQTSPRLRAAATDGAAGDAVRRAFSAAAANTGTFVLAVSGGLDSMVLLHAVSRHAAARCLHIVVASFDHGTGAAAREAVELVRAAAQERNFEFVAGKAAAALQAQPTEAAWRAARWDFLMSVAAAHPNGAGAPATICTAHNQNDQVETVLMRSLRGAGARGLAALEARSRVLRPLLGCSRDDIARYAVANGVRWIEDPSNSSRKYLRNRIRHELLPALELSHPGLSRELLDIGSSARVWRRDLDAFVESAIRTRAHPRGLDVAREDVAQCAAESLAIIWPAIAARAGLATDRRGAARAADFILNGSVGAEIQLSGDWRLTRSRHWLELRRIIPRETRANPRPFTGVSPSHGGQSATAVLDPDGITEWRCGSGCWKFSISEADTRAEGAWGAILPADAHLTVRAWSAGDRIQLGPGRPSRKVKRLLAESGVTGERRASWPVVLDGSRIVWIPGVCRSDAATERSGRPALAFVCAYLDR